MSTSSEPRAKTRRTEPLRLSVALLAALGLSACQASRSDPGATMLLASEARVEVALAALEIDRAWSGDLSAFDAAREHCDAVAQTPVRLDTALSALGSTPVADAGRRQREALEGPLRSWLAGCQRLASIRDLLIAFHDTKTDFEVRMPALQARIDMATRQLAEQGAAGSTIYLAARQLLLIDRIRNGLREQLAGGPGSVTAGDRLARDLAVFSRVLEGLIDGNPELGIAAVKDATALEALREARTQFREAESALQALGEQSVELAAAREDLDAQKIAQADLMTVLQGLVRLAEAP